MKKVSIRDMAHLGPARSERVHRGARVGQGRIQPALKRGTKGRRLLLFVAALLLAPLVLRAQTTQQKPPTFRTATDVVPLTITVLDKSGNPVTDLKASDFTIREDGKPREILNFFTQAFAPDPAAVVTGTLNRAAPKSVVKPETRRTFLIVLGYGRIQYPTKAVDGALAFVRERLMPQDLVAVIAFDRATDFTGDHAQVIRMLERYRSQHERIVFDFEEWLQRRLGNNEFPPAIRADIDAVFTGVPTPRVRNPTSAWSADGKPNGTIRRTVPMLFGMNRQTMLNEKPWDRSQTLADLEATNLDELVGVTSATMDISMLRSSILKANAGIEYLRYLEGDKHMLYLGESGLVPFAPRHAETNKEDDAKLARRLNDARVTLHMVRTTGPPPPRFNWKSMDDLILVPGFQYIAELNGGTYTGVTYADKALERVDRASRFSYLLGYAPSNPALDGKYRRVEVTVNRPGLVVRHRHGYFSMAEPEPLELKDLITSSRLEAAAAFGGGATDIKVDARASLLPRMGTLNQLRVDVTIDASRLAFLQKASGRVAEIELRIHVGDEKQRVIGSLTERLTITADEPTQAALVRDGIPYSGRMTVTGIPKYVKVLVYDYGSDLVGTFTITLK